jgi:hypothetical protein
VQLDGDALVDGTVTSDKITVNDALTLRPGASFFAGRGDTRFAFGDFPLSKKDKGKQNHDGLGAAAFASEGGFETKQDSRTRTVSLDTTDPWAVAASADYAISLNGNAGATSSLEIVATVNGTQVGRNLSSASTGSGRLEVIADLDLSAFSGTVSVDIEIITRSEAFTFDDSGFDSASASTGDLGNDANDPTTNVISSTDFFGPDGAVWRAGGQVQVEINGRGNSSSQTTGAGQIWVRDEISAATVTDRSSDRRLKSDLEDIDDPFRILHEMEGKTFTYRGERSGGLIAQDALGVYDAAVSEYEEDGTTHYALDQRAFMGPVVEGMKELDDRLSQVEDQINA